MITHRIALSMIVLVAVTLGTAGCKDEKKESDPGPQPEQCAAALEDFDATFAKIDEDLARTVLAEDGWEVGDEAFEMRMTAAEIRQMAREMGMPVRGDAVGYTTGPGVA